MKLSIITLLPVYLLLLSSSAMAENVYSDQFQRIQEVEFFELKESDEGEEIEVKIGSQKVPSLFHSLAKNQGQVKVNATGIIMMTRELIALGKEIYQIIKAGKPVVTVNTEPVEVLPRTEDGQTITAFELSGWKKPLVKKYRVKTKNYLGMAPASFDFMLIYSYGGAHEGKGAYITGAQVKPTAINVKWGYSLDVDFKVQSILNQGTAGNPIAGAVLMLDYKISTVLQESRNNKTFFINGLGETEAY